LKLNELTKLKQIARHALICLYLYLLGVCHVDSGLAIASECLLVRALTSSFADL